MTIDRTHDLPCYWSVCYSLHNEGVKTVDSQLDNDQIRFIRMSSTQETALMCARIIKFLHN